MIARWWSGLGPGLRRVLATSLILCLLGGGCASPYLYNNYKWSAYRRTVEQIPLPPETEQMFLSEEFGLRWGTGNSCSYEVRKIIATTLSKKEVEEHYRRYTVASPDESQQRQIWAEVYEMGAPKTGESRLFPLFDPPEEYRWFLVIYHGVTEPGWDMRCR